MALKLISGLNLSDRGIPGVQTLIETYLNGPLEGLLNVQPLAHDGLVQLPLKSQQIHVSLRLWNQFPDLSDKTMVVKHPMKHTEHRVFNYIS